MIKYYESKKIAVFLICITMIITVLSGCVSKDNNSGPKANNQKDLSNSNESEMTAEGEFADEEFLLTVEKNESAQKTREEEMINLYNSEDPDGMNMYFDYMNNEYPQTMSTYLSILEKYKECAFKDESLASIALEYIDSISVLTEWYTNGADCGYDMDKTALEALYKRVELCGELQNNYNINSGYSDKYFQVMTALYSNMSDLQFSTSTENGWNTITTILKNNTDVTFESFFISVFAYAPSGERCGSAACFIGEPTDVGEKFNPGDEIIFKGTYLCYSDEYDYDEPEFKDCIFLVRAYAWENPDAYFEEY